MSGPQYEPPSPNVLWAVLGVNLAVYTVWHTWGLEHVPFMRDHFMVSYESIASGRVWTLLTSELFHVDAMHLLVNLFALYVFGRPVQMVIGSARFVGLYVFGALCASIGYVAWAATTGSLAYALGASGAVSAIAVCYALWFPRQTLLLFFFIPMPAWLAVIVFIALDVLGLFTSGVDTAMWGANGPGIAHSAHLGGAAAGLVVGLWVRSRLVRVVVKRPEPTGPE